MRREYMTQLVWTDGYKYQLEETFTARIPVIPEQDINWRDLVTLNVHGILTIYPGFAWDGASGFTLDTNSSMRTAVIHDALYLLMRKGLLDIKWKKYADKLLRKVGILDGMFKWRAKIWRKAVEIGGLSAATKRRKIYRFPKEG